MKKRKKWPWVVLACVVVIVIAVVILLSSTANKLQQKVYTRHDAVLGDVTASITASGTLKSGDSEEVTIPEGIEITDVLVKKGDKVIKGEELAKVDIVSARIKAGELEETLLGIDSQLQLTKRAEATAVTSSVSGIVKAVYAEEGDPVTGVIRDKGSLMLISTGGRMYVDIKTDKSFSIGKEVSVKYAASQEDGEIFAKTEDGYRVILDDDNAPYNESAEVYIDDVKIASGTLEIDKKATIYANGGVIEKAFYDVGDKVSVGSKLFSIDNGEESYDYISLCDKRERTAEELESVLKLVDYPYVLAPEDGIISQVNVGDSNDDSYASAGTESMLTYSGAGSMMTGMMGQTALTSNSSAAAYEEASSSAFVIEVGGITRMTVAVNELDISSIAIGKSAMITVDAFPKDVIQAEVAAISNYGEVSGSMTTYSVELKFESDDRLLWGMNGSAVIVSDSVEDAIIIPLEAVNEDASGEYVYVSDSGDVNGSDIRLVRITTGLSDGENVEVKEGLAQGDKVMYVKSGTTMLEQMMSMREEMLGGGDA